MKRQTLIITALSLLTISPIFASDSAAPSMKGRLGIGSDFSGIGIRYWFSNKWAMDLNADFIHSKSDHQKNNQYGARAYAARVIQEKGHLRLLGLFGIAYSQWESKYKYSTENYNYSSISETWSAGLDLGLGVEYSFQELPDLSFGAFVTGVGIGYSENDRSSKLNGNQDRSEFDKGVTLSSRPTTRLAIRYYF